MGTGLAGAALARLPRSEIRNPLYAFILAGVCWAAGDWIAEGAPDATSKHVGIAILYTGAIAMPALWWVIALRWAEEVGARLPLRSGAWQWLPLAWAGLMWSVMITNPWHGAFLTPVLGGGGNVYHAFWFGMALPNYGLVLASLVLEIAVARRVRRPAVRRQAAFLIAASSVTLVGNWLYVTGLAPVNLTAPVLALSISLLVVGMAREGLFGVVPAALSTVAADHPDGIVVVGDDGYPVYANRRAHELLAPVPIESDRTLVDALRDPRLRPEPSLPAGPDGDAAWWRALSRPTGVLVHVRGRRQRWVQAIASAIGDGGSARGRLLHLYDATERHQAELHAGQTRRLESVAALALSVARDFQGAFAIVRGNADLLERELKHAPAQRHLDRIFEAARVGTDLAQELHLYAGGVRSPRTTVELSQAVDETCDWIEPLPPGVRVLRRMEDRLLPVQADPIQLRDCVFQLLRNAVEATAEYGGRVEVSTRLEWVDPALLAGLVWGRDVAAGDFACVQVRDEGGGMDEETEERAFEPFFSSRHKDRGSGLPTVLGIARAHEALVVLENDPGRGCRFAVYFPLASG